MLYSFSLWQLYLCCAAVQVVQQIYDAIAQTGKKQPLFLGHTNMLSKVPFGSLQAARAAPWKQSSQDQPVVFSCFPGKSNSSENCLNWFEVMYSLQGGVLLFIKYNSYNETFVTVMIEEYRQRHRQLRWTLKSATYCICMFLEWHFSCFLSLWLSSCGDCSVTCGRD